MKKKYWFKAKRYGWGWYPVTWQGWAITMGYMGMIFGTSKLLDGEMITIYTWILYFIGIGLLSGSLILIAYKTGEKPRWRWGGE